MLTNEPRAMIVGDYVYTPTGWKCPKCGIINAPTVLQCPCSRNVQTQDPFKPYSEPYETTLIYRGTESPKQMLTESNNGKL